MSLVVCKTCNKEISDEAMKCIHCGASTQRKKKYQKRIIVSVFSIVIVCFLLFAGSEVYKNYQNNMQKQAEESRQEKLYNSVVFYNYYDHETFGELQNVTQEYEFFCDFIASSISMPEELYENASVTVAEIAKEDRDGNESKFIKKDSIYYYIVSDTKSESKMVLRFETESLNQDNAKTQAEGLCILYTSLFNNDNKYLYGAISSCSYKGYSYVYFGLTKNA